MAKLQRALGIKPPYLPILFKKDLRLGLNVNLLDNLNQFSVPCICTAVVVVVYSLHQCRPPPRTRHLPGAVNLNFSHSRPKVNCYPPIKTQLNKRYEF